jgi:hypothetical protein
MSATHARIPAARINPPLRASLARTWRTLTHDLFDSYRPERHYMRGPGPKSRAKQAGLPAAHAA